MAEQLLWIEIVSKGAIGLVLLLFPKLSAKALGLPLVAQSFWPRMLAGALLGIAAAIVLGAWLGRPGGLGLAGAVAVNFAAAVVLAIELTLGRDGMARRGRVLAWIAALALAGLGLVELAWV